MATAISIQTTVNAGRSKAWTCMTRPEHITQWNFASPEWCCPSASMELVVGGKFSWRMEAKDGIMGFDFGGTAHSELRDYPGRPFSDNEDPLHVGGQIRSEAPRL